MSGLGALVARASRRVRRDASVDRSRAGSVLIILSRSPFEGDATWNALRLAGALLDQGATVRAFVMNDAIDLVRQGAMPEGAEFDLQAMLRALLARGARIKICTTCVTRCGLRGGDVMPEAVLSSMADLAAWLIESDRAVTF
jgi:uncharacterized protein involved in oxidation of intracellular sulfur